MSMAIKPSDGYASCAKCGATKPLDEFYKNSGRPSGHDGRCIACIREHHGWTPREVLPEGMSRCAECHELKPVTAFHKNKRSRRGVGCYCIVCCKVKQKNWNAVSRKAAKTGPTAPRMMYCIVCGKEKIASAFTGRHVGDGDKLCRACRPEYSAKHGLSVDGKVPKFLVVDGKRTCARCRKNLSTECFDKNKAAPFGIQHCCHDCYKNDIQAFRGRHGLPMRQQTDLATAGMKRCKKCGATKPVSDFNLAEYRKDGCMIVCKACVAEHNRQRYAMGGAAYTLAWLRDLAREKPLSLSYWKTRVKPKCFDGLKPEEARALYVAAPYCAYCEIPLEAYECQLDHRTPRARGGKSEIVNMAIVCGPCNRAKSAMTEMEYRLWLKALHERLDRAASRTDWVAMSEGTKTC